MARSRYAQHRYNQTSIRLNNVSRGTKVNRFLLFLCSIQVVLFEQKIKNSWAGPSPGRARTLTNYFFIVNSFYCYHITLYACMYACEFVDNGLRKHIRKDSERFTIKVHVDGFGLLMFTFLGVFTQ